MKRDAWHVEIGTVPACCCGLALAEAGCCCGARTRVEARDAVRKLKAAGWTRARVVKGPCPDSWPVP